MLTPIFTELAARLGDSISVISASKMDQMRKPPQVRWLPLTSRIVPSRRAGGGPGDDGPIAERIWSVEMEVWASDFEATLALLDLVRANLHDIGSHYSFPAEGIETWNHGGTMPKGVVCMFQLTIATPVLRTTEVTEVVTDPEKIVIGFEIDPQPIG